MLAELHTIWYGFSRATFESGTALAVPLLKVARLKITMEKVKRQVESNLF